MDYFGKKEPRQSDHVEYNVRMIRCVGDTESSVTITIPHVVMVGNTSVHLTQEDAIAKAMEEMPGWNVSDVWEE